jgi:hypothetical protein
MTMGVGIFGVLASYLANLFLPTTSNRDADPDLTEIKAELAALNSRLDAIQAMLGDQAPPSSEDPGAQTG